MSRENSQLSRLEHIILSCRRSLEGVEVAFFTLYFDDSGTHLESPVAVASMWIAPVLTWKRFESEWEGAKEKYGFKCFHASECLFATPESNKKSEFASWDEPKRVKLFRRLTQLSMKFASKGFAVAVNKKDYDELVPDDMREKMGRYHYTWAVKSVLGFVEQWRSGRTAEKSEYIFDTMSASKGDKDKKSEIEDVFEKAANHEHGLNRYGIYSGCLSFRDRCDLAPLQASDLLAWCVYQRNHYEITHKEPSDIAMEAFNAFTKHDLVDAYFYTRQALCDFVKSYPNFGGEPPVPLLKKAASSR